MYFYVVIVHLLVTITKQKITDCYTTMLLWRTHVAGNNDTYLGLHADVPDIFIGF